MILYSVRQASECKCPREGAENIYEYSSRDEGFQVQGQSGESGLVHLRAEGTEDKSNEGVQNHIGFRKD